MQPLQSTSPIFGNLHDCSLPPSARPFLQGLVLTPAVPFTAASIAMSLPANMGSRRLTWVPMGSISGSVGLNALDMNPSG